MASPFERIRYYFNRCKPDVPVPADDPERWYVDFDRKGLRGERCIRTAASTITLAEQPTCQLFTGFSGSGKTSELLRLVSVLEQEGYFVVYADASESLDLQNEIVYSDVLIALGLAVGRKIDEAQEKGVATRWWSRFSEELGTLLLSDVKLPGFKLKPGEAELGIELKENPSFKLQIRDAANAKRRQLLEQARKFFGEADRFVKKNGSPRGLVIILDNLEKLSSEVQASTKAMFLNHADALKAPGVHMLYTVPARIVFSKVGPELGKLYDGEPLVLPMVKFSDRKSGEPFLKGRRAMGELLLKRLDVDEVFDGKQEAVDALVERSGGYTRDLLRLAQYAIQIAGELPITQKHVDAAVAKLRKSYVRGYSTTYHDLLVYVDQHRPSVIPAPLSSALEEVIDGHFAMIYGNDQDWYDVHPLVRDLLLEGAVPPVPVSLLQGSSAPLLPAGAGAEAPHEQR